MIIQKVKMKDCKTGDVVAEDVFDEVLDKLIVRDTILNEYMLRYLTQHNIYEVYIYTEGSLGKVTRNKIMENYCENINLIKEAVQELSETQKINMQKLNCITDSIYSLIGDSSYIFECLNKLRDHDEYTYTHCMNVTFYSMLLAKWASLPKENIKEIITAALLHDIGKVNVPNEILNKPDKLNEDEFYEIKKHTIYGYDIVKDCGNLRSEVANSILMHHERMDGSGYPLKLKGYEIPLPARIIAIVDVFDAMISDRVYKDGDTPFTAFQMFITEGMRLFDITLMNIFLENISIEYLGMKVLLSDGRSGEIAYIPPKNILYPIIKCNNEYINLLSENKIKIEAVI